MDTQTMYFSAILCATVQYSTMHRIDGPQNSEPIRIQDALKTLLSYCTSVELYW